MLDGIEASAQLYGQYIESYLHSEEHLDMTLENNMGIEVRRNFEYDVSNVFNVWIYQIWYVIKCPFMGFMEIGKAGINAIRRDTAKKKE